MNIFVDGSYSPQKSIGVGAYMIITSDKLLALSNLSIKDLKIKVSKDINYMVFVDAKGSTDVEQRILDVALDSSTTTDICVYTDCQKTQSTVNYKVVHIKGHTKQINRISTAQKLFDVVDKSARKKLREIVKKLT